jgi:hypothetical protein
MKRSAQGAASRREPSDTENVKPFFLRGITQAPIQGNEGEALGVFLGGQERSGEL